MKKHKNIKFSTSCEQYFTWGGVYLHCLHADSKEKLLELMVEEGERAKKADNIELITFSPIRKTVVTVTEQKGYYIQLKPETTNRRSKKIIADIGLEKCHKPLKV